MSTYIASLGTMVTIIRADSTSHAEQIFKARHGVMPTRVRDLG